MKKIIHFLSYRRSVLRLYLILCLCLLTTCRKDVSIIVYYDINGGTGTSPKEKHTGENVEFELASADGLTTEGYGFVGWNTKQDGNGTNYAGGATVSFPKETLLFANWREEFTVTFNANVGSGTMANQIFSQGIAQNLTANSFTRPNYTFAGWNTNAAGTGTNYTNQQSITVSANIMLYAKWSVNTYVVTLDPDGGTVSPTNITVAFGLTYGSLPTPTKTSNTFVGWFTQLNGHGIQITATSSVTITANQTLYANWDSSCPGMTSVTDCQGNIYNTVQIGAQCWTKENMKATKYDTNSERPNISIYTSNSADHTPYYTDGRHFQGEYSGNLTPTLREKLGYLYNWAAAVALSDGTSQGGAFSGKRQGICPNGWHVPTYAEWHALNNYLGNTQGYKMKNTSGWYNNGNGSNSSDYTCLPSGSSNGSTVFNVGNEAEFWAATASDNYQAYSRRIEYYHGFVSDYCNSKNSGHSVRCIKD